MKEHIVSLDQGSSSSRALLFDLKGNICAEAQSPVKTLQPRAGWFEHRPEEILKTQTRALEEILVRAKGKVLGIGLAAQRSTIFFWDKKTGRSIGSALSWQDSRNSDFCRKIHFTQAIEEKTGLRLTPFFSASKIRWALEHIPELRKLSAQGRLCAGPATTFLLWHWTKGEVFAADPTMAQRTLLFNIHQMGWDKSLLELFGIPEEMLPRIVPSIGPVADYSWKGRKIPVLAVLGDQQAAFSGAGCFEKGQALLNHGTGAFFLLNAGGELRKVPGLLTSIAWAGDLKNCRFLLEGTVHSVGPSYDWLEQIGILKNRKEIDPLCARSKNGVWALPALSGLGAPHWAEQARGVFEGISLQTRREDMVRSVTEGIAFLVCDIFNALKSHGHYFESISATGGISRINYLLQFESDLFGMPVSRLKESESTALGAAFWAAKALGVELGSAVRNRVEKVFKPGISKEKAESLYGQWQKFLRKSLG